MDEVSDRESMVVVVVDFLFLPELAPIDHRRRRRKITARLPSSPSEIEGARISRTGTFSLARPFQSFMFNDPQTLFKIA